MNPASLYTYFENLDAVFTAVILDSFRRLGDTLQTMTAQHADEPPVERLVASALAYRRWALEHPAEFNLVFTDQIPGYAAPPGGPTVEAQDTIFRPFITAIAELLNAPVEQVDPASSSMPDDPSELIALWGMMHGLVMLEINHHLPFIDDREALFATSIRRAAERLHDA
jgi:AcrR family transcriptional regulator